MAVTKTTINGDLSILQTFLQSTGLFGSVELGTNSITLKDADGNTLAVLYATGLSVDSITAYADASNSVSVAYWNSGYIAYGYKCTNGAILFITGTSSYGAHILMTKTNNDKVAFIFSSTHSNNVNQYLNYQCVAWGDGEISANTFTAKAGEQTLMCAFATNASLGTPSYTPKAYWLPWGQLYNMGYGKFAMNGEIYLTNGYWTIVDSE